MLLADFLLARLSEDEAVVRRVADPISGRDDLWTFDGPFDPDFIIAGCEARRRVIEAAARLGGDGCDSQHGIEGELILRALALPYADHQDFREEWRP